MKQFCYFCKYYYLVNVWICILPTFFYDFLNYFMPEIRKFVLGTFKNNNKKSFYVCCRNMLVLPAQNFWIVAICVEEYKVKPHAYLVFMDVLMIQIWNKTLMTCVWSASLKHYLVLLLSRYLMEVRNAILVLNKQCIDIFS